MVGEKMEKTTDVLADVSEHIRKVCGKINSLDSRSDRAKVVSNVINDIIASAELSRLEKVGIMATLTNNRIKG